MRTWNLMTAFLLACSGSDTGGDTNNNGGDDDDGNVPPINGGDDDDGGLGCDQIPEFNTDGMDCEELGAAMVATIDAALQCNDANDCRAIKIQCEDWDDAFCYAIVNTCIGERDLDQFHPSQNGQNCDVMVPNFPDNDCQCHGAPAVDCVNGFCDEKFTPP